MADTGDAPGGGGRGAGAVRLMHHGSHQAQARHGGRARAAPCGHLPARSPRAQVEARAARGARAAVLNSIYSPPYLPCARYVALGARAAAAGGAHPTRHRQATRVVRGAAAQRGRREAASAPLRPARMRRHPRVRGAMRYLVITPCSPRVRGGRPLVAITPYTYMHVHMHMQVGVLKLLCLMVDGPAEAETRVQVAPRPSPLAPRPVDHRVPPLTR
jgi:hypothetical protein